MEKEIIDLGRSFDNLSIENRLKEIKTHFPSNIAMTSAFGYSGMILMYFLKDIYPEMPVYFIDTGYHFPETLKFVERVKKEWDINIITLKTKKTRQQVEISIGQEAYTNNPDLCCLIHKVEPLEKVLPTKKIWLSALRRDQAITRSQLDFIEIDARENLKAYPLVDWTRDQCWKFIRDNNVLVHPMHDKKYPSIGCTHCTIPVEDGQQERAGRWNSFPEKLECGIHQHKNIKS